MWRLIKLDDHDERPNLFCTIVFQGKKENKTKTKQFLSIY